MRKDAAPSGCDVVGCDEQATGSYLHAWDSLLLEFAICTGHHARLQTGVKPVVITERFNVAGLEPDPVLILE